MPKNLAKSGGFRKNIKWGDSHIRGLPIEEGGLNLLHIEIERLKGGPWSLKLLGGPQTHLHTMSVKISKSLFPDTFKRS